MSPAPTTDRERPAAGHRWAGPLRVLVMGLVVVGIALRLISPSPLWLDEALSVNIASLPVSGLLAALRHDGSPPLYYLILHGWIQLFGSGAAAVRALSVCVALATLPVVHRLGRRFGGPTTARLLVVLVATNPFLIRYSTETRMYALLGLLVALGAVVLDRARSRPDLPRLAQVSAVCGLLMLTHYWAFFLLAAVGAVLTWASFRGADRTTARRLMAAEVAGAVLFLPWLSSFRFQLAHTGTPWAPPPGLREILTTVPVWAGGTTLVGWILAVLFLAAAVAAVLQTRQKGAALASLPTDRAVAWALLACSIGALVFAVVASRVAGAGYAVRYTVVFLPPLLLLVALGLRRLRPDRRLAALVVVALLGTGAAAQATFTERRTQAGDTAAVLRAGMAADDVVVYCPDQLGPAVSRLLPADLTQFVYPTLGAPQLVDWVDYAQRNAEASPVSLARTVDGQVAGRIWLVTDSGYLTFADDCEEFAATLTALRGTSSVVQHADGYFFENEDVISFPARTGD